MKIVIAYQRAQNFIVSKLDHENVIIQNPHQHRRPHQNDRNLKVVVVGVVAVLEEHRAQLIL